MLNPSQAHGKFFHEHVRSWEIFGATVRGAYSQVARNRFRPVPGSRRLMFAPLPPDRYLVPRRRYDRSAAPLRSGDAGNVLKVVPAAGGPRRTSDAPHALAQERNLAVRLTPKQAAERAGVSSNLIYLGCKEGRLALYRLGSEGSRGRILIDPADLDRLMEACRQERHPLLAE